MLALVALLGFQNCSPSFREPDNTDPLLTNLGGEDPQPEPTPPPPPADFRAGDPVNRASLGDLYTFEMRALLDFAVYENFTGAKALALAANGLGAVRALSSGTQDDADRGAIEACNAIAGQACTLILSGGFFAVDSNRIPAEAKLLLKSGSAALNVADVPFIADAERTLVQNYLFTNSTSHPFKALALSPSGEYRTSFGKTQSEANRRALQACEFDAVITPCLVFAEGNQRVFNLAEWDRAQRLALFPAEVRQDRLPFIFDEDVADLDQIFADINAAKVVSIAIGRSGSFAASQQPLKEDADGGALSQCRTFDDSCFLYSSNKKVALRWDQLPTRQVLRAVVCAIPRATCADHRQRGCAAATRWVGSGSNLRRAACE